MFFYDVIFHFLIDEQHKHLFDKVINQKLEQRIQDIIRLLELMPHDIVANREVDKFYYMQKLAELRLIDERLYEALECVRIMMAGRYETRLELVRRWKKDVRWLALRVRKETNI